MTSQGFRFKTASGAASLLFAAMVVYGSLGGQVARLAAQSPEARSNDPAYQERWQAVYIGDTRAGYMHSLVHSKQRNGQTVILNESEVVLSVNQLGRVSTSIQTDETTSGDLLAFKYESQDTLRGTIRTTGQVAAGKLLIENVAGGNVTKRELAWDNSVKGPAFHDKLMKQKPLQPNEKRTIKTFDAQVAAVDTIQFQAGELETVRFLDGSEKRLLKVAATHSVAPGLVMHEYMDSKGDSLKTTESRRNMAVFTVTKDVALQPLPGVPLE